MDSGRETDDQSIVDSNCDMMSMVFKKFPGSFRVDWIVEHLCSDVRKNALIAALQNLDFDGHSVALLCHVTVRDRPNRAFRKIKLERYLAAETIA